MQFEGQFMHFKTHWVDTDGTTVQMPNYPVRDITQPKSGLTDDELASFDKN